MTSIDLKSAMDLKPAIDPKLPKLDGLEGKKLWKATTEFESMFMDIVMKSMRATVMESDLMGNSSQTKMFQEMLDQEWSKSAGKTGKFGLASAMYKQMVQRQMAATAPETKDVK